MPTAFLEFLTSASPIIRDLYLLHASVTLRLYKQRQVSGPTFSHFKISDNTTNLQDLGDAFEYPNGLRYVKNA